jgi:hypothetical protein
MMMESSSHRKAPFNSRRCPWGLMPQRLGYANDDDDDDANNSTEYVPVTRHSRLAAPSKFTTNFKDKAVTKAFQRLTIGEIKGRYGYEMIPRDGDGSKDEMHFVLRVGTPTGNGTGTGTGTDMAALRQVILKVNGGDSNAFVLDIPEGGLPVQKIDANRNAKLMKKCMKTARDSSARTANGEACYNCGVLERSDGQPNFRCPCHKAVYCSKECQLSHRKEHKKICTAVVPKKQK